VAADEFALTLAWIDAVDEARIEMMTVPRDAYDQLAEAGEAYKDLRALLTEGPFVDMNRMLIDPADREVLPDDAAG